MGRAKAEKPTREMFAVMRAGRYRREVKAWQYYSVFDFCRSAGCDRGKSEELARWCMDRKRKDGDSTEERDLEIRIVEKEVAI